jgi:hypothetical protein
MPKSIDPDLHARWADRLRRQPQSGLSIARFCSIEGVSPVSFHAWKRRLRVVESADQLPTPSAAFLPLTIRNGQAGSARVEVELPGGVHIRIHASDPDFACRVLQLVASAGRDGPGAWDPC